MSTKTNDVHMKCQRTYQPISGENGTGIAPIVEQWFSGSDMGSSRTVVSKEPIHFRFCSFLCQEAKSEPFFYLPYTMISVSADTG